MLEERLELMEQDKLRLTQICAALYRQYCIDGDTSVKMTYEQRRTELSDLVTEILIVKQMLSEQ